MRRFLLALLAVAAAPAAAMAGMPMPVSATCPVGGETFTYITTPSYSIWGERPDGKPYGSWTFPLELAECPGNGLVMFKTFSDEEKAALPELITAPEYRQMADSETSYYRAAWLARALDPDGTDPLWLLLRASWQADRAPARKTRYQAEFVKAVDALAVRTDDADWRALQARAVNAERELGRFDAALARMRRLRSSAGEAQKAAEGRAGWLAYLERLEPAILRRDASAVPLDAAPAGAPTDICLDKGADARPAEVCASEKGRDAD